MPRENGQVADGTRWSETEAPVPLGSHSQSTALVEPASNGTEPQAACPGLTKRARRRPTTSRLSGCFGLPRDDRTPAGAAHCFT